MAANTLVTHKRMNSRKLSRKTALSLGVTLAASVAVSATVRAAAPIVVTQVEHGAAGFSTSGNTTTITAANQTIIDYSKFDIPTGDTVRFIQPDSTATVLNRISGASPTAIDGNLFANGIVYMVNPAGVMFGAGSVINVGQIFAAAGSMSNADFLQGVNHFTDVSGSVLNAGNIHASAVNFVGQMVANSGEIIAPRGTVVMAAGHDVLIGQMDGNMFVKVSDAGTAASSSPHAAVSNTGTIDANSGQVNMSAGDMFSLAIHNTGTVTAGNITLHGGSNSTVLVSGKLDASNQGANGTGGTIKINSGNIGVGVNQTPDGAYTDVKTTISATGTNGGGKILIGVKADSSSATGYSDASNYDYIGADALLEAQATGSGAGGLVDTSGATLTVSPTATILTAGAAGGASGQWLLDPVDIQVTGSTSGNIGTATAAGTTEFSPTAATPTPATVAATAISDALSAGDNVIVSTSPGTGPTIGTDKGDIILMSGVTIDPVIPAGSNVTLTLSANNNIDIEGTISAGGPGIMNVNLNAAGVIYIGGTGTTPGAGSISTFSSAGDGGNVSANTNGGFVEIDSTATWAINTSGTLGGGSVSINSGQGGPLQIIGSGIPSTPGLGGIATGGGSLLLDSADQGSATSPGIFIGAVTLSTAGYAPGSGGGGIGIIEIGSGNIQISGTTMTSNGTAGTLGGAAGGAGAIGIATEVPDGGYRGEITLQNVTFNAEGNGGGSIRVWPGAGDAGYLYQPITTQNPAPNTWVSTRGSTYPYGDGFLVFQGTNIINTAQIGPVVAGLGTGGNVNIAVSPPTVGPPGTPISVTWTINGGGGGAGEALSGGGLSVKLDPTVTFQSTPSGSGSFVGGGAAAGVAGASVFNAFNTYFETYGTGSNVIQPSVISDGGGQDYENAEQPPGETAPSGDQSIPFIVGHIYAGGNESVAAPTTTVTLSDTGSSATGAIIFDGRLDAAAAGVDNLIVTTTAGSISYNYPVSQITPLQTWTSIAGTSLALQEFIPNVSQTLPSYNNSQFSTSSGTELGQLQFGDGPAQALNNSIFDFNFVGGVFLGTTAGNMFLEGAIVDANVVTYGTNNPIHTGAVILNSPTGDIDLEAYLYGAYYNNGQNSSGDPLSLTSGAPATIAGAANNAITVDGGTTTLDGVTYGDIVPVEAIFAYGGQTLGTASYSGFSATATSGGNILLNGPSPATTAGLFPVADGLISNGGFTVYTLGNSLSVLAINSDGNSGNIVDGQSVALSGGDVSVASVGTTGNAGNLTFGSGAKISGDSVAITSLCLDSTPGFTSGNVVFNLSNLSQTSTGFVNSDLVYIISGNYLGSSGNVSIGGYVGITGTSQMYIASVASPTASILTTTLGIVNAASGSTFSPPTPTSGLTGNAGYVTVGNYASLSSGSYGTSASTVTPGFISIGSYSTIGNSSAVSTGLTDALQNHIIASADGTMQIFSDAQLGNDAAATVAAPGSITINGTISTSSAGSAGNLLIENVGTGTLAQVQALAQANNTPLGVTVAGTGLLKATSQSVAGGAITLYAPYGVTTIDLTSPTAYAVDVNGASAGGSVYIYGSTGVNIVAGGISAQGGINNGHGGGGGISIGSGGWINVNQANINSSSAYGGGGGVAIFSTNTTGAVIPTSVNSVASAASLQVNLGSGSVINTSGGGFGGGGAVLIAGSGNVSVSGATITASGNGGGAIALDSGAGKIIFASSNTFTSLQVGTINSSFGGGGGYIAALTGLPQILNAGGGGGASGGYAGGGVKLNGTITGPGGLIFPDVTMYPGTGSGTALGATTSGGNGSGIGGANLGGNAGSPGRLTFSGSEIDFGTSSSTTPVSLITNGNGQIYNDNIVLYAPTTLTESASGDIVFNNTSTPTTISTAAGVTAGLTVLDNSGNIIFGNNFSFSTANPLSSLSVTDTSGVILLETGGGNFVSTTSGSQTFSGTTWVDETGSTGSLTINAGGEITLTGSLTGVASSTLTTSLAAWEQHQTPPTGEPLSASLTSSQAYASGAYAIDVGLNVNTGGGNFLAYASGGGNIQLGLSGIGASASSINTTGTTSNGSITIESIASTGNSGGIVMSTAGESLITGGAGASSATATGPGSVFLESSATAGTAQNINITGPIDTSSTTGNGGYVTIETIGQAGTTGGNITIGSSTASAGTGYITTVSTAAGFAGGGVVLNSGTGTVNVNTAGDPGIAINASGAPGGSIILTGFNGLDLTVGNITSGGGIITLQNQTGLLTVGGITLDSSSATGSGGNINIQTASGGTGSILLNGVTLNSGSTTTVNGGAVTVNSLGTLTLSGVDTFNSAGTGTPGPITLTAAGNLNQTSSGSLLFTLSGNANPLDVTFNPGTPTGTVNLAGTLAFTGTYTGTTGPEANLTVNSLGALALGTMNGDFALAVNTLSGGIIVNGPLGQGVNNALYSVGAYAGTSTGSTTGGVTVNQAITTTGNIILQPNAGTHLGGAGSGDNRPNGILAINANLTSDSGYINLSPAGCSVVPSVATMTSSGSVTIDALNGNVTMGQNERYTGLGSVTIESPNGTASLGDIYSLGSINVTAATIDILLRNPGQLLTSIGTLDSGISPTTDGTSYVANGAITFSVIPSLVGTGNPPLFASVSGPNNGVPRFTINPYGAGTPFAGQLITPGLVNYDGTILALTANGPVLQIIQIYTQNVAPVLPQRLPTVQYPATPPALIGSWDQSILQGVGVNASYSSARQILAAMMGTTIYENSMYGVGGPQGTLPAGQYTPSSVRQFLNVYHKIFSFEAPANYSPYKPSGWFTRPTWYEVAGRRRDIHNTLSLAYSLYQDSLGASPTNETFLQFVDQNRTQSKIFIQAANYMDSLQQLSEAIYQMGITPSEFATIEGKFFKPLAPDGMPFDEFMSEIAPAQLLSAGPTAE